MMMNRLLAASMLLGCIGSNGGFSHICLLSFGNQLVSLYLVDVILAFEDTFEGERVVVHRSLALRHLKHVFVRVHYNEPEL